MNTVLWPFLYEGMVLKWACNGNLFVVFTDVNKKLTLKIMEVVLYLAIYI